MEKAENRFKLGIPRIFKSSFASCRSRIFSDATTTGFLLQPQPPIPHSDIISTHSTSFRSICKPKSQQTALPNPPVAHQQQQQQVKSAECRSTGSSNPLFYLPESAASSPVSSLIIDREFYHNPKTKQNRRRKKNKSRSKRMSRSSSRRLEVEVTDDDEEEVFFSSRSRSTRSDSSAESGECEMLMMKDQYNAVAVVKSSSDPYEDFRTSMVEMIVEKQILSGQELEKLLQSFLVLNSRCHHRVILEVFMEIWEALFCDTS